MNGKFSSKALPDVPYKTRVIYITGYIESQIKVADQAADIERPPPARQRQTTLGA